MNGHRDYPVTTRVSRSAKATGKLPSCSASPTKTGNSLSSDSLSGPSSDGEQQKYAVNFWFLLLRFAVPDKLSHKNEVIETFEAFYHGKRVFDATVAAIWNDPFATFMHFACELLLPVTPFGGFGGGSKILFWGEELSRNNIIAKLVSFVTEQTFTAKQISSRKQTIIKSLLSRFDDRNLHKDVRNKAGVALVRIARGTPLTEFLAGYLSTSTTGEGNEKHSALEQSARRLIAIDHCLDVAVKETGWCAEQNRLFFSPLLAHMLGLGSRVASRAEEGAPIVYADERLHPVIAAAASGFGKMWWRYLVKRNMELVRL